MLLALRASLRVALLAVSCVPGYTKAFLRIIHYEAQFLTGKETIEEERMRERKGIMA